jgi:hypothetical protein
MLEIVVLSFALIVFLTASATLVLNRDFSHFTTRVQFSIRTLLILLAIGPPMLAWAWSEYAAFVEISKMRFYYPGATRHSSLPSTIHINRESDVEEWNPEDAPADPARP